MSEKPLKRQSFLHGAAILALGTIIVKLIGAIYKIPLGNIIDDAGYGYFTTAYDIYAVLLAISTAGLPVAMSRMISKAQALGNSAQIKQIYRASLYVFIPIGIIGSGGMLLFSQQLAKFMNSPNSWASIMALAPAVLFVCVISSFRGFFQGQSNMTPTAISQIFEALCKLIVGLLAAKIAMERTGDVVYGAAAAILGVTAGTVISAIYLAARHRSVSRRLSDTEGEIMPLKMTIMQLLVIAIPITIGAAGLQIINLIDSKIVMGQLVSLFTPTMGEKSAQEYADVLKGIYNFCQTIFNLPAALTVTITVSIIPSITRFLTMRNRRGAWQIEESAVRITALIGFPCGVGFIVLAKPILKLLRSSYGAEELAVGGPVLSVLGIVVGINCLVLLLNAIMQAHGNVKTPVYNMIIGGIVKVIVNYYLVSIPTVNILGAPIGTLCCFTTILVLDLISLRKMLAGRAPRVIYTIAKPLFASAVMGGATWAAYGLLGRFVKSGSLACLGAIVIAVIVYVIMVIALKIITLDDCMLLPKGEKIAKILNIH